ncbi:MAG: hypothetical protein SGJ15_06630 [Bacteroidota bacterium]|nr:hypothetical protein [Bacteroidota bacterium]
MLIIFSGVALSLLYFPFSFYFFSDKSLKRQNIVFSIVGGMVLSNACFGIIFKIMRWQYTNIASVFSLVGIAILIVVYFIISQKAHEEFKIYYHNYKTRLIYWSTLSIAFFFLNSKNILQIEHRNDKKMLDIELKIMEAQNKVPEDPQLNSYYHYRDSLSQANEGYTNYVRGY